MRLARHSIYTQAISQKTGKSLDTGVLLWLHSSYVYKSEALKWLIHQQSQEGETAPQESRRKSWFTWSNISSFWVFSDDDVNLLLGPLLRLKFCLDTFTYVVMSHWNILIPYNDTNWSQLISTREHNLGRHKSLSPEMKLRNKRAHRGGSIL